MKKMYVIELYPTEKGIKNLKEWEDWKGRKPQFIIDGWDGISPLYYNGKRVDYHSCYTFNLEDAKMYSNVKKAKEQIEMIYYNARIYKEEDILPIFSKARIVEITLDVTMTTFKETIDIEKRYNEDCSNGKFDAIEIVLKPTVDLIVNK